MNEDQPGEAADDRFETMLEALDLTVRRLESGELDLSEALAQYERGVGLVGRCRQLLETAEKRVALLTGRDGAGEPVTAPFDSEAGAPGSNPKRGRSVSTGRGSTPSL
jgi:exodeoxyribonuclease VII small subunit